MQVDHLEIVKHKHEIENKIKEKAQEIEQEYFDKDPIVIGCLNGAFMFYTDFVKQLKFRIRCDFVKLSSYTNNKIGEKVTVTANFKYDLKDQHVILIEDIVDTGRSMNTILQIIKEHQPKSIKLICLFGHKVEKYPEVEQIMDYLWLWDEKSFFTGYGFDDHEYYRQLTDIYKVKK